MSEIYPEARPIVVDAPPAPLSLRDKILAADDLKVETVFVAEWDATVGVKSMTGQTRARMLSNATDPETGEMDFANLYADVVIATAVDPETQIPLFTTGDRDLLNQKSGAALETLAQAGMKVSGMTKTAEKELGNG